MVQKIFFSDICVYVYTQTHKREQAQRKSKWNKMFPRGDKEFKSILLPFLFLQLNFSIKSCLKCEKNIHTL